MRFAKELLVSAALCLGGFGASGVVLAQDRPCSDQSACSVLGADKGTYHLVFPDDWDGQKKLKPFVFFHGHNGSGAGVTKSRRMIRTLGKKGYLLVAPDGPKFNFGGRTSQGWAARMEGANPRGNRDDVAFVEAVLKDAAGRVPLELNETVVAGFSSGGSMAWYFACYSQQKVRAVVAIAGGLRRPLPGEGVLQDDGSVTKKCPGGPRKVLHIHGFTDLQVPLEGRGIRAWHQGDVFEGLAVQRHTNQCGSRPNKVEAEGRFWCREWTKCRSGVPIRFCLHPGGHGLPKGWLKQGFEWVGKD